MALIDFAIKVFLNLPAYALVHPFILGAAIILGLIGATTVVFIAHESIVLVEKGLPRVLYRIGVGSVAVGLFLSAVVFVVSDYASHPDANFTSTQFYVEVIVVSVVYMVLRIVYAVEFSDWDDDQSNLLETLGDGLLVVVMSFVFILTDFEHSLGGFGPVLFGKSIGSWVLSAYWSNATFFALLLFRALFELLSALPLFAAKRV